MEGFMIRKLDIITICIMMYVLAIHQSDIMIIQIGLYTEIRILLIYMMMFRLELTKKRYDVIQVRPNDGNIEGTIRQDSK